MLPKIADDEPVGLPTPRAPHESISAQRMPRSLPAHSWPSSFLPADVPVRTLQANPDQPAGDVWRWLENSMASESWASFLARPSPVRPGHKPEPGLTTPLHPPESIETHADEIGTAGLDIQQIGNRGTAAFYQFLAERFGSFQAKQLLDAGRDVHWSPHTARLIGGAGEEAVEHAIQFAQIMKAAETDVARQAKVSLARGGMVKDPERFALGGKIGIAAGSRVQGEGVPAGSFVIRASSARSLGPMGQAALGAARVPPGYPNDSFLTKIAGTGEPIAVESDEFIVPPATVQRLGKNVMERINRGGMTGQRFADGGMTAFSAGSPGQVAEPPSRDTVASVIKRFFPHLRAGIDDNIAEVQQTAFLHGWSGDLSQQEQFRVISKAARNISRDMGYQRVGDRWVKREISGDRPSAFGETQGLGQWASEEQGRAHVAETPTIFVGDVTREQAFAQLGKHRDATIAQSLGVSKDIVFHERRRRGIPAFNPGGKKSETREKVRELLSSGVPAGQIAEQVGMSTEYVNRVRSQHGLDPEKLKRWTDEERQFVVANVGKMSAADMGHALGRSVHGVQKQLAILQSSGAVSKQAEVRPWTPEEKEFVQRNAGTMSQEQIGEAIGRSRSAVQKLLSKMRTEGEPQPKWTQGELFARGGMIRGFNQGGGVEYASEADLDAMINEPRTVNKEDTRRHFGHPAWMLPEKAKKVVMPAVTPAMRKWLGKAEPRLLFHGTRKEPFTIFKTLESHEFGSHFGTFGQANQFAEKANYGKIAPIILKAQTPLRLPDMGQWMALDPKFHQRIADATGRDDIKEHMAALINKQDELAIEKWNPSEYEGNLRKHLMYWLEGAGYDSIVYKNIVEGDKQSDSYIAFRPNQIKSIANRGTFDQHSPNMMFEDGGMIRRFSEGEDVPYAQFAHDEPIFQPRYAQRNAEKLAFMGKHGLQFSSELEREDGTIYGGHVSLGQPGEKAVGHFDFHRDAGALRILQDKGFDPDVLKHGVWRVGGIGLDEALPLTDREREVKNSPEKAYVLKPGITVTDAAAGMMSWVKSNPPGPDDNPKYTARIDMWLSAAAGRDGNVGHLQNALKYLPSEAVGPFLEIDPSADQWAASNKVMRGKGIGADLYLHGLNAVPGRPYFYNSQVSPEGQQSLKGLAKHGLIEYQEMGLKPANDEEAAAFRMMRIRNEQHVKRITPKGVAYLEQQAELLGQRRLHDGGHIETMARLRHGAREAGEQYAAMPFLNTLERNPHLLRHMPEGSQFLGVGTDAIAFKRPDNLVVRIQPLGGRDMNEIGRKFRPAIHEMLQPNEVHIERVDGFAGIVEHLPFAPAPKTRAEKQEGEHVIKQLARAVREKGYQFTDQHLGNIGKLGDRNVIIDPSSVYQLEPSELMEEGFDFDFIRKWPHRDFKPSYPIHRHFAHGGETQGTLTGAVRNIDKITGISQYLGSVKDAALEIKDMGAGASKAFYSFLTNRYGKAGAAGIIAAGNAISWAGHAAAWASGLPLYVPGSAPMASMLAVGAVEAWKAIMPRKAMADGGNVRTFADGSLVDHKGMSPLLRNAVKQLQAWRPSEDGPQHPSMGQSTEDADVIAVLATHGRKTEKPAASVIPTKIPEFLAANPNISTFTRTFSEGGPNDPTVMEPIGHVLASETPQTARTVDRQRQELLARFPDHERALTARYADWTPLPTVPQPKTFADRVASVAETVANAPFAGIEHVAKGIAWAGMKTAEGIGALRKRIGFSDGGDLDEQELYDERRAHGMTHSFAYEPADTETIVNAITADVARPKSHEGAPRKRFSTGQIVLPDPRIVSADLRRHYDDLRGQVTAEKFNQRHAINLFHHAAVNDEVLEQIPQGSKLIGSGISGLAFRAPKGHVVRIQPSNARQLAEANARMQLPGHLFDVYRPPIHEVLQPFDVNKIVTGEAQHTTVEHLPWAPAINTPESGEVQQRQITRPTGRLKGILDMLGNRLEGKGYYFADKSLANVGKTDEGRHVIIDPGSIVPIPGTKQKVDDLSKPHEPDSGMWDWARKAVGLKEGGILDEKIFNQISQGYPQAWRLLGPWLITGANSVYNVPSSRGAKFVTTKDGSVRYVNRGFAGDDSEGSVDAHRADADRARHIADLHLQAKNKAKDPATLAYHDARRQAAWSAAEHSRKAAQALKDNDDDAHRKFRDATRLPQQQAEKLGLWSKPKFGSMGRSYAPVVAGESKDEVKKAFGLDISMLPSLVGAPDDATVCIGRVQGGGHTHSVAIQVDHPNYNAERYLHKDIASGELTIENASFFAKRGKLGQGLVAPQIVPRQIEQAQAAGVKKIVIPSAIRSDHADPQRRSIGYYAWPLYGWNKPIADMPDDLQDDIKDRFPKANDILDVMAAESHLPKEKKWWFQHGRHLENLEFDLAPESKSMQAFKAYGERTGKYAHGGIAMRSGDYVIRQKACDALGPNVLNKLGAKMVPGRSAVDDVPATIDGTQRALLMGGEAIVPRASVEQHGRAAMETLNHAEKLPRFASGGNVRHFDHGGDAATATNIQLVSGEQIPAQYEIRDLFSVKASNRVLPGGLFKDLAASGEYPKNLQPRNYTANQGEQLKVLRQASALNPSIIINKTASATEGPSVIDQAGHVLSGSGRQMTLEMAYHGLSDQGKRFEKYKSHLVREAASFGADPARVARVAEMKAPALYRKVALQGIEAERFARAANVSTTQSQSTEETAASLSHLIPANIGQHLSIDPESTFSETVSGSAGGPFRDKLLDAITREAPTKAAEIFQEGNKFTKSGTEFVQQMLLAKVLPAPLIRSLKDERPKLLQGIEKAVPQLLLMERGQGGVNVAPQLIEALGVYSRKPAMKSLADVEAVAGQKNIFGEPDEPMTPGSRMMLDFLAENRDKPNNIRGGLVNLASGLSVRAGGLFGEDAFDEDVATSAAGALGVQRREGATFGDTPEIRAAKAQREQAERKREQLVQYQEALASNPGPRTPPTTRLRTPRSTMLAGPTPERLKAMQRQIERDPEWFAGGKPPPLSQKNPPRGWLEKAYQKAKPIAPPVAPPEPVALPTLPVPAPSEPTRPVSPLGSPRRSAAKETRIDLPAGAKEDSLFGKSVFRAREPVTEPVPSAGLAELEAVGGPAPAENATSNAATATPNVATQATYASPPRPGPAPVTEPVPPELAEVPAELAKSGISQDAWDRINIPARRTMAEKIGASSSKSTTPPPGPAWDVATPPKTRRPKAAPESYDLLLPAKAPRAPGVSPPLTKTGPWETLKAIRRSIIRDKDAEQQKLAEPEAVQFAQQPEPATPKEPGWLSKMGRGLLAAGQVAGGAVLGAAGGALAAGPLGIVAGAGIGANIGMYAAGNTLAAGDRAIDRLRKEPSGRKGLGRLASEWFAPEVTGAWDHFSQRNVREHEREHGGGKLSGDPYSLWENVGQMPGGKRFAPLDMNPAERRQYNEISSQRAKRSVPQEGSGPERKGAGRLLAEWLAPEAVGAWDHFSQREWRMSQKAKMRAPSDDHRERPGYIDDGPGPSGLPGNETQTGGTTGNGADNSGLLDAIKELTAAVGKLTSMMEKGSGKTHQGEQVGPRGMPGMQMPRTGNQPQLQGRAPAPNERGERRVV